MSREPKAEGESVSETELDAPPTYPEGDSSNPTMRVGVILFGLIYFTVTSLIFIGFRTFFDLSNTGVWWDAANFGLFALASFIAMPLIPGLKHFFVQDSGISAKDEYKRQYRIFSFKGNQKRTLLKYTLLLYLFAFLPLDFFSYLIPGILDYQTNSLISAPSGQYFYVGQILLFILISISVHACVAFREELMFRGVLQYSVEDQVGKMPAILTCAVFFGMQHFNYFFQNPAPLYLPLWWGFSGIVVGLVLGTSLSLTGSLLPGIFAHWMNNVISTIAIWSYVQSGDVILVMSQLGLLLYLPLFLILLICAVYWRKTIHQAFSRTKREIKTYFSKSGGLVIVDILLGLALWFIMLLFGG